MNIVRVLLNLFGFPALKIISQLFGLTDRWSKVIEPTLMDIGKVGFSCARSSALWWLPDYQNANIGKDRKQFAHATSLSGKMMRSLVNLPPEMARKVGYISLISVEMIIVAFVAVFSSHAWVAPALLVYFAILTSAGMWIAPVFAKHGYQYALNRNRLQNRALRGDTY